MNSKIIRSGRFIILLILSGLLFNTALAEKTTEIYKWVDKDGRIHYAARPGDKNAQKMHLGSNIFHKQANKDLQHKEQQKNDKRAKLCQDSKDTLAKYKRAPFLYRFDNEKQQKIRLTEDEAKEAFVQAEKDISYWCNPPAETQEK